jgi:hypothetical protein
MTKGNEAVGPVRTMVICDHGILTRHPMFFTVYKADVN